MQLWMPALCRMVLFVMQLYSHYSIWIMDKPSVLLCLCFMCCWSITFSACWKSQQKQSQHDWDTANFEVSCAVCALVVLNDAPDAPDVLDALMCLMHLL